MSTLLQNEETYRAKEENLLADKAKISIGLAISYFEIL